MEGWERFGEYVVAQRVRLGYPTRPQFAVVAQLSARLLGDIENARRGSYDASTIAKLERALKWGPGSTRQILQGGEPTLLTGEGLKVSANLGQVHGSVVNASVEHPADEALIRIMRSSLSDEEKARIIRLLIAEQQRFAERYADELIRLATEGDS